MGGPPLAWVAFPVVGEAGARWPALAGRALHLAACTAALEALPDCPALLAGPELEYVFWPLPDGRVLALARDRLLAALAAVAPTQLQRREVTVGGATREATVLAAPASLLGYAAGEELVGLRYRRLAAPGEGTVLAGPGALAAAGSGFTPAPPAAAPAGAPLHAGEVERRLKEAGGWLGWAPG